MTSQVVRAGTWAVSGRDLDFVASALKLAVESARRSERADAVRAAADFERLLRDVTEAAFAASAPQAAQVAREVLTPQWHPTDLITVKEAADLMKCTESNVRQMTNRRPPTLSSWPGIDGRKMVSRAEAAAKPKRSA